STGRFVIAYPDNDDSSRGKFVIYNNDGSSDLSETTFLSSTIYSLAIDELTNGRIVFLYYNYISSFNKKLAFQVYALNGGQMVGETVVDTEERYLNSNSIVGLQDGGFALVYQDAQDNNY